MRLGHWLAAVAVVLLLGLSASASAEQKTIQDTAEYNAYIAALNTTDPVAKAAAMEDFVKRYPGSVVKLDALEQAMHAYQQAGNQPQLLATARRVLQVDKDNVRALAIVTALERVQATPGDAASLAALRGHAEQGLRDVPKWPKPDGTTDADYAKMREQMTGIFAGALGFALLNAKDYVKAREAYRTAVKLDPGNLQDVYQLSIAELEMSPSDADGFWHIAKAIALAQAQNNAAAVDSMVKYGKAKYKRYHGGEDGWDEIVAAADKQTALPANFAKSIVSQGAAIAVKAVKDNDPATLSFSDWEYVLSYRDTSPENKKAADTVWQTIQAKQKNAKLKIPVWVVSATKDGFLAAITDDNRKANKADLRVSLAKQTPTLPGPGTEVAVIGVLSGYTPNPFMFTMKDAELAK